MRFLRVVACIVAHRMGEIVQNLVLVLRAFRVEISGEAA
jgi:hypothetical protein